MQDIFWKTVEHTEANLVDLAAGPVGAGTLRFGHDDDALRQPVVTLFTPPLRASDPELSLQLLDEAVLRGVLVHDDGSHLPAQVTVSEHGVNVGRLLCASDH